jgi:hypothetical protein
MMAAGKGQSTLTMAGDCRNGFARSLGLMEDMPDSTFDTQN